MVSLRARLGRIFVWKVFNMNPDGGKSFAEVTQMVSDFRGIIRHSSQLAIVRQKYIQLLNHSCHIELNSL